MIEIAFVATVTGLAAFGSFVERFRARNANESEASK